MKKLHRLVLSSFVPTLLAIFIVVMFVLIMQFLWLYIDDLIGKGLNWLVVAELILYASSTLVPMALPISMLLSSIMTMGNLGEHNELLALKASGISLIRIMKPLLVVAIFFTLGSFLFSNNILPYTNLKFTSLLFSVKQQRPELQIKEGVFYDGIEGYTIKVDKKDDETGLLRNVMIYDHSAKNSGNKSVTTADSGYIRITKNQQYLIITLYDGYTYEDMKEDNKSNRHPFRSNSFKEQEVVFELAGYGFERTDEDLFKNQAKMLTMDQLQVIMDSLGRERNERALGQVRSFVYSSNFSHSSEINKMKDEPRPYTLSLDSLMQSVSSDQRYSISSDALRRAKEARSTLVNLTDNVRYINREVKLHEIEWHRKISFSLSCLIFFFIGAPLGAIIRKGGIGTPFVISLALFLLYYIISMSCERLAKNGNWDPAIAMWMSTLLILPLGIFFTYKAVKDQTFVMPRWYTKFINSFSNILNKFFNFKR